VTRALAAILLVALPLSAVAKDDAAYTYGVGTFSPEYVLPAAGTYELPPIQTVRDHRLLGERGDETTLFDAIGDRIGVVAFIYTTCVEAAGCPLSTAVLHRLDRALADDAALRDRVALLSVSFDPERDTPDRMRERRALHEPAGTWRFLTTRDAAMLDPLLADFGQRVAKLTRPDGAPTNLYRHVLKVFLLDRDRRVRNIYSAAYLHADLVLNDVRTILAAKTP
jgi:cytochrome c peroxidase